MDSTTSRHTDDEPPRWFMIPVLAFVFFCLVFPVLELGYVIALELTDSPLWHSVGGILGGTVGTLVLICLYMLAKNFLR